MQIRRRDIFDTVKTEGGLLPADFLARIVEGDGDIQGLTPEAYHLAKGERLGEAATRAWNRLLGAWESFRTAAENLPDSDVGTTLTRERWLLILFQELGYGRLTTSKAYEIEGRSYPISHTWQKAPIHLVSFRLELDRRAPGVAGAARVSPHSLMQEFLNRSDDHLWGFLSNGWRLRFLRDNVSLSRASYVEFDLQAMMDSEAYSDFFLLYLLCHQSRVEVPEDKPPEQCWLEKWRNTAAREGTRVLDRLRDGVQQAIETLGGGFLAHRANGALRESLRSGELGTQEYYRQVLRVVYRLLFLFVAEDRGLLLDPDASETARETYTEHYSTRRLRQMAERRRGTRHPDLYRALRLVFVNLYSGCAELALPALGSYLFRPDSTADLNEANIRNSCLLAAIRHLAFTVDENVLRPVDYRNLGPEELGSVYESLLEMHPRLNTDAATFALEVVAGSERKSTGSYYTPTSLVSCLLDSALDPVLDHACKAADPEKALLDLKVCDPACGSGHFLIAAANRLAKRLATVRAGEDEPAPESIRHALRDVIGRCVYGVDVNPMAVELCKTNLWLESVEPGRPLSFLDHHIQCGNSLLGTTPALLEDGIPDDAFKPIKGDVKSVCKEFKKRNRQERKEIEKGQSTFGFAAPLGIKLGNLPATFARLDAIDDSTLEGVEKKREQYARLVSSSDYKYGRLLADAWCAAFVWKKNTPETRGGDAITEFTFRRIEENPHALAPWMAEEIERLRDQYHFFHWHLVFPDVFRLPGKEEEPENEQTGWSGGFDCVLGNPPWETLEFKEKEWFAGTRPDIAEANTNARKRKIKGLAQEDLAQHARYKAAVRRAEGERALVRDTGRFPLCARGKVNTFSIFAELKRSLLNPSGRVGCIVPSGIATDDTTKFFFQNLIETGSLVSLYSFENEEFIFPAIHHATKFCLLTMAAPVSAVQRAVDFAFFARQVEHLAEKERHFTLTADDIALINPNTRTCPIFRHKQDAELTKYVYRRVPVLFRDAQRDRPQDNLWGVAFRQGLFNMSTHSGLFRTQEQLEAEGFALNGNVFTRGDDVYLPLYEGKMFWHFDHRFGTYEGQTQAQANQGKLPELTPEQHADPDFLSLPRYWVDREEVRSRIPRQPKLLASALSFSGDLRREAVRKAFCYWGASFYRKAGDERRAEKLLQTALPVHHTDTPIDDLKHWLLDYQCEQMQERFPLTHADVQEMGAALEEPESLAEELVERFSPHWFVAFRDVTSAVVLRTAVFSIIPKIAVGHKAPLAFTDKGPLETCCFVAAMNSFPLDYVARQSIGGSSMSYFILKQLPVVPPNSCSLPCPWDTTCSLCLWLAGRTLELSCTAWDLTSLGADCGYDGPPFIWDEERRFLSRAELDAAFFHLYLGTEEEWKQNGSKELLAYFPSPRHAVEHIMDTFRILRERDEAAYGTYRTKDTILEIYDEMAEAIAENSAAEAAGRQPTAAYQTRLDPPPGPPTDAAGNFIPMAEWDAAHWPPHIHQPREAVRPVPVPAVAAEEVQFGRAVAYINLLLHTWGKPVVRDALEAGLVFMLNDSIRQRVLRGTRPTQPAPAGRGHFLSGMDAVLSNMKANGAIDTRTDTGRMIVTIGRQPVSIANAPAADVAKTKEAIQAVQKLGESRTAAEYAGVLDVQYTLV